MTRRPVLARTAGATLLLLLLTACDFGETLAAGHVADTSAELEGVVHTDGAETVTWWFEHGPTRGLGTATPEREHTSGTAGASPVSEAVTGLAEGSDLFFRLCVRNEPGGVVCGARRQLTTTTGRDSVHGSWRWDDPSSTLTLSAAVHASSGPDGTDPEGTASRLPGFLRPYIADEGPVTCLRVSGNRAVAGYVADHSAYGEPDAYMLLYIEDGPAGDSYSYTGVDDVPTTCPDPTVEHPWAIGPWPVPADSFVVHDHP